MSTAAVDRAWLGSDSAAMTERMPLETEVAFAVWNNIYVYCPYCTELHEHSAEEVEKQKRVVLAPCLENGQSYEIKIEASQ